MKSQIEKRLNALEEYVSEEMEAIRNLSKEKQIKTRDLFSIKTYSEVCVELKEDEQICPYKKIKQIEKLFNGDWKKDWNNKNQYKYYPYYKIENNSLVFLGSVYSYGCPVGQVGFYKDQKTSDYVSKTFISIYKEIIFL